MKKIYTTITLLVVMLTALCFVSCGNGDDEDGIIYETVFSVTVDGTKHEYDKPYMDFMDLTWVWENNSISIETGTTVGAFRFRFPSGITFSSFTPGYSSFENDAERITIGITSIDCTYVSGSATVMSNDGKNMKLKFNNYKFKWNKSREIIFDGMLNIVFRYQ